MQDVPKIVLKRLPATPHAEPHPDANLLTAFAEQALGDSERARVMQHLARCGDCREAVAFTLPDSGTVTVPGSVVTSGRGWLTWPVLRWGVVAAGILVVTSVGVVQYKHRQQQNVALFAKLSPQERTASTEQKSTASPPGTSEPRGVLPQTETAKRTESRKTATRNAPGAFPMDKSSSANAIYPPPPSRAFPTGSNAGSGAGRAPSASSRESFLFAPAANRAMTVASPKQTPPPEADSHAAIAPSSQVVEVQSEAAQIAQNHGPSQVEDQQNAPLQNRSATSDVVKAKDVAAAQAASEEPSALALPAAAPTPSHASPRWAISSNGSLQRSMDAGETWDDVNVSQSSFAPAMHMRGAAEYKYAYKDREKKSKENDKAQPPPTLVFRAVAALDAEVWAGGSGAMLFHSVDSGTNWIRVLPAEGGVTLTGDIVSVEFSDPKDGRIATSTAEVWTTTNAGQTWHRQQ